MGQVFEQGHDRRMYCATLAARRASPVPPPAPLPAALEVPVPAAPAPAAPTPAAPPRVRGQLTALAAHAAAHGGALEARAAAIRERRRAAHERYGWRT